MSRTDKDRPFWVISNDPYAKNNILYHRCGYWGWFANPLYDKCNIGVPRTRFDGYYSTCGYLDPREKFWYRGYEDDTRPLRAKKTRLTHNATMIFNTAMRHGTYDEVSEEYDYPDSGRRHYVYSW